MSELAERVRWARALVFDFDGTLVDSNPIKQRAFRAAHRLAASDLVCFGDTPEDAAAAEAAGCAFIGVGACVPGGVSVRDFTDLLRDDP